MHVKRTIMRSNDLCWETLSRKTCALSKFEQQKNDFIKLAYTNIIPIYSRSKCLMFRVIQNTPTPRRRDFGKDPDEREHEDKQAANFKTGSMDITNRLLKHCMRHDSRFYAGSPEWPKTTGRRDGMRFKYHGPMFVDKQKALHEDKPPSQPKLTNGYYDRNGY